MIIGISLGHTKTDPVNQMITKPNAFFYSKYAIERYKGLHQPGQFDPIN